MVINIKANFIKEKNMAKGNIDIKIKIYIKAYGTII